MWCRKEATLLARRVMRRTGNRSLRSGVTAQDQQRGRWRRRSIVYKRGATIRAQMAVTAASLALPIRGQRCGHLFERQSEHYIGSGRSCIVSREQYVKMWGRQIGVARSGAEKVWPVCGL
jgi:hypothetical protein